MTEKIDFVVTWVDGSDQVWKRKHDETLDIDSVENAGDSDTRYRDYDLFKFWFRAVELFAPWVNHVYVVTDNQIPNFLDTDYSKVSVVDHKDFIPHEYLPTFNSNVIEMFIDQIPGLSENFVLFNDDMFLNKKTKPEDFFKNGLARDQLIFQPLFPEDWFDHIRLTNLVFLNQNFRKHKVVLKHFFKIFNYKYRGKNLYNLFSIPYNRFNGFYDPHISTAYTRSQISTVREQFELEIFQASHKVRHENEASIWLMRYVRLLKGEFAPQSITFGKNFMVSDVDNIVRAIETSKYSVIGINDEETLDEVDSYTGALNKAFENKYNFISNFEKRGDYND